MWQAAVARLEHRQEAESLNAEDKESLAHARWQVRNNELKSRLDKDELEVMMAYYEGNRQVMDTEMEGLLEAQRRMYTGYDTVDDEIQVHRRLNLTWTSPEEARLSE